MASFRYIVLTITAVLFTAAAYLYADTAVSPSIFKASPDRISTLSGTWQVKKGSPDSAPDGIAESAGWDHISVPGNLMDLYPGYTGTAWYKTRIVFQNDSRGSSYVIQLGKICDVDETYFNGKKIGATGDPSNPESHYFDRVRIYLIPSELIRHDEENILLVKTRGYLSDSAGLIWHKFEIGPPDLMNRSVIISLMIEVLIAGVYLFIAFFFLIFARLRSALAKQQFVLSIVALCLSVYIACQGQLKYLFFETMMPFHYAQYISGMTGTFAILLLFRLMFKEPLNRIDRAAGLILLISAVYITATMNILMWGPPRTLWHLCGLYIALVMIKEIISAVAARRKEYAFLIFGFSVTTTSCILEILRALLIMPDFDYMAFGLIGLIINISFFLADQISIIQRIQAENSAELESMVRTRTRELDDRNNTIEDQLAIARKIQSKLMPDKFPDISGIRIEALYMPIDQVGGDFYDISETGGEIRILMGDVSGHGVPGAFLALIAKMTFQQIQETADGPAETLKFMNKILCKTSVLSHFSTALVIYYNKETGIMRYSNAGHIPGIIIKHDESVEKLYVKGTLLGINPEAEFSSVEYRISAGDRLVLYTDGITECCGANRVMFGEERLISLMKRYRSSGIKTIKEYLIDVLTGFTENSFDDDITLLTVEFSVEASTDSSNS